MRKEPHPHMNLIVEDGFKQFGHEWQRLTWLKAVIPAFIMAVFFAASHKWQKLLYTGEFIGNPELIAHYVALQAIPIIILVILFPILFTMAAYTIEYRLYKHKRISYKQLWKIAEKQYWSLLLTFVLQMLFITVVTAIPVLLGVLFSSISSAISAFFYLGAIVVFFIASVFLTFTLWACLFENRTGGNAMWRSYQLTYYHWWPTFGRLLLLWIIGSIISMFLSIFFFPLYTAGFLVLLNGNVGLFTIVQFISGIIHSVAFLPMFAAVTTWYLRLVHYDRIETKLQKNAKRKTTQKRKTAKRTTTKASKKTSTKKVVRKSRK